MGNLFIVTAVASVVARRLQLAGHIINHNVRRSQGTVISRDEASYTLTLIVGIEASWMVHTSISTVHNIAERSLAEITFRGLRLSTLVPSAMTLTHLPHAENSVDVA